MAIGFDASSESHTGTSGSASQASFTWTHTPVGSPTGILVFTFTNANADNATAVSWGGLSLTAVSGGRAVDTAGEPGDCKAWFFGGTTSQLSARSNDTVTVTRTNNANVMYAVAVTVTSASGFLPEVHTAGIVLLSTDGTLAEQSVTDGSPGSDSMRFAGINSGLAAIVSNPTTPGTNNLSHGASSTWLQSIDFGARVIGVVRETTAGQGSRSVGFRATTSDDRAAVHLAIKEVPEPVVETQAFTASMDFTSAGVGRERLQAGHLRFASGFEVGFEVGIEIGRYTVGGTVERSSTYAKNGTHSARINRTGAGTCGLLVRADGDQISPNPETLSDSQTTGSYWLYIASLPTANISITRIWAYGHLHLDSTGALTCRVGTGGTPSATIATLSTGQWYQIEVAYDASAETIKARVNGGTEQSASGTGGDSARWFEIASITSDASNYDIYVDDITVWDGYTFPGEVVTETLRPDEDVDTNWSIYGGSASRHEALSAVPWNTTTGIESSTAGQTQTVGFGTATLNREIIALQHKSWYYTASPSVPQQYMIELVDGSGNAYAGGGIGYSARYAGSGSHTTAVGPSGSPLTQSDINSLRVRYTHESSTRTTGITDAAIVIALGPIAGTVETQTVTGTLSFTSAQIRTPKRTQTGTLSFTSAQAKKVSTPRTATLSFTSAQTKKAQAAKTAALSFTSDQTRRTAVIRALTATLSFTSAQTKKVQRATTATLSFASAQAKKVNDTLTAALSFTSAQAKKAARAATATLSFTSAQTRQTIVSQITQALTATLSFTSAQTKKATRPVTAVLSFTSAQVKSARRPVTATLSFTSAQVKKGSKLLTASLTPSAALTRATAFRKTLDGALSFSSNQTKRANKVLVAATLSFTGATTRLVRQGYTAAGSFTGSLLKRVRTTSTATVDFSGQTTTQTVVPPVPTIPPGLAWLIRWRKRRRDNT
jgi:hypothetical protein